MFGMCVERSGRAWVRHEFLLAVDVEGEEISMDVMFDIFPDPCHGHAHAALRSGNRFGSGIRSVHVLVAC